MLIFLCSFTINALILCFWPQWMARSSRRYIAWLDSRIVTGKRKIVMGLIWQTYIMSGQWLIHAWVYKYRMQLMSFSDLLVGKTYNASMRSTTCTLSVNDYSMWTVDWSRIGSFFCLNKLDFIRITARILRSSKLNGAKLKLTTLSDVILDEPSTVLTVLAIITNFKTRIFWLSVNPRV
jgi:hypothetical protein